MCVSTSLRHLLQTLPPLLYCVCHLVASKRLLHSTCFTLFLNQLHNFFSFALSESSTSLTQLFLRMSCHLFSGDKPLSSSVTPSFFHPQLQTHRFHKSFLSNIFGQVFEDRDTETQCGFKLWIFFRFQFQLSYQYRFSASVFSIFFRFRYRQ